MTNENDEPHAFSESLQRFLSREDDLRAVAVLALMTEHWSEIVGDQLAEHTAPAVVRSHELVISVDHPTWATEVKFHSQRVLEALEKRLGAGAINSIKVHVRG